MCRFLVGMRAPYHFFWVVFLVVLALGVWLWLRYRWRSGR